MDNQYENIITFHGHSCPGLAIGYRMAKVGLDFLSGSRAADEEIVAIVENDACGVDALQYITGCTFGKGNLIFKDYGKQVYTLYNRQSKKGVRVVFSPHNIPESTGKDRDQFINWLLSAPEEDVVSKQEVHINEPELARIMKSVVCDSCGEHMIAARSRQVNGKTICIPCAEEKLRSTIQSQ